MKIAILSFYSGHSKRGVETFVEDFSKRLSGKHKVIIYQTGKTATEKRIVKKINLAINWNKKSFSTGFFRYLYLDYYSRRIFKFTLKALKQVKKINPDIIIPVNGGWQTVLCRLFCWLYGKKMVVVGHAGFGWDDRFNLYCWPNTFVALSDKGAKWAKKICPIARIAIIPYGVDLRQFVPIDKKIKIDLPKPIILSVSALQDYKRIDKTIKAAAGLKEGSLLLIGTGDKEQEKHIDLLGKKLLGSKRYLRIQVDHKNIPQYYRSADLFTLVSGPSEAFGLVYLEALASNLSVVAVDDELRHEIIGQAGLFVKEPVEIEEYTDILQKALDKKWGNAPRRQAEKFSWDKAIKEYEKLFRSLSHPDRKSLRCHEESACDSCHCEESATKQSL